MEHVLIRLAEDESELKLVVLPENGFALDRMNGERFLLPRRSPLRVGRKRPAGPGTGADVVLRLANESDTAALGRIHLEIDHRPDGEIWVVDRSASGTLVNGTRAVPGEWICVEPGTRLGLVPLEPALGRGHALVHLDVQIGHGAAAVTDSINDRRSSMSPVLGAVRATETGVPFSKAFLKNFEFVRLLGEGSTGAVYLMHQLKLGRHVAVKVVRPDAFTAEEVNRLLKEAKVLARLQHANVMTLHDMGMDGDRPYLVCEYVEGDTLHAHLAGGAIRPLVRAIAVMTQIVGGLCAAHDSGVVHRDLKPSNILMSTRGQPKIADFGVARSRHFSSRASDGCIFGTPMYMSPEQCRGRDTSPSSDVYSAGVILFQATSGQLPFRGPGTMDYLTQHATVPAPAVRTIDETLPEELDRILRTALAKEPADRHASGADFLKDLLALYRSLTTAPVSPPR